MSVGPTAQLLVTSRINAVKHSRAIYASNVLLVEQYDSLGTQRRLSTVWALPTYPTRRCIAYPDALETGGLGWWLFLYMLCY